MKPRSASLFVVGTLLGCLAIVRSRAGDRRVDEDAVDAVAATPLVAARRPLPPSFRPLAHDHEFVRTIDDMSSTRARGLGLEPIVLRHFDVPRGVECVAGRSRTVTLSRNGTPVASYASERPPWWSSGEPVPEEVRRSGIQSGSLVVDVDGVRLASVAVGEDGNFGDFRFDPSDSSGLTVVEISSGCFVSSRRIRFFERDDDGFVAGDGMRLSLEDLNELRDRVLATRPTPGRFAYEILEDPREYLDGLGITEEVIAVHASGVRESCADGWTGLDGAQLSFPAELEELFGHDGIRRAIVAYLFAWNGDYRAWIEIPGDPWIHLGTQSSGSRSLVPWYATTGDERWYVLDQDVGRALAELRGRSMPPNGREQLDTLWSDPAVWTQMSRRAGAILAVESYRALPGWDAVDARFVPSERNTNEFPGPPSFRVSELQARERGASDVVVRSGAANRDDWNDLLADYERAERLAARQPLLAAWRAANSDVSLAFVLPLPPAHDIWWEAIRSAWTRHALPGVPVVPVSFRWISGVGPSKSVHRAGYAGLGEDGTLLIVKSSGAYGPLTTLRPEELAPQLDTLKDGACVIVRPDGTLALDERNER